jgi:hypothetical protein
LGSPFSSTFGVRARETEAEAPPAEAVGEGGFVSISTQIMAESRTLRWESDANAGIDGVKRRHGKVEIAGW